jgi:hypothetical protein
MRSVTSLKSMAAAAALALSACGNYSTEDLRFLAALPQREDLAVAVPARADPSAAAMAATMDPCANGTAEVWLWAKPTSDNLNKGVDFIVSLIDAVRRYPPTAREQDARRWGPFPDEKHPGHEVQVVLERSWPGGADAPPEHDYRFEARRVGEPTFEPILVGTFTGASSARGSGTVMLDFAAIRRAGVEDGDTPAGGAIVIQYDRASDPTTIALEVSAGAFGVVQFRYAFEGYRDGGGAFLYRFEQGGNVFTVATGYDAAGAGRAAVIYDPAGIPPPGSFRQCWNPSACLTYVDDPANYTCSAPPAPQCSFGTVSEDCPTVQVSPF